MTKPLSEQEQVLENKIYEIVELHRHDVDTDFTKDIRHYRDTNETVADLLDLILQDRKVWGEYVIGAPSLQMFQNEQRQRNQKENK